jgi:hypothetical protein
VIRRTSQETRSHPTSLRISFLTCTIEELDQLICEVSLTPNQGNRDWELNCGAITLYKVISNEFLCVITINPKQNSYFIAEETTQRGQGISFISPNSGGELELKTQTQVS